MSGITYEPFIKWAGGKRWLTDVIKEFYTNSEATSFVEPFFGGGACAFAIEAEKTIVNDINPHLMNMYRHVKSGLVVDLKKYGIDGDYYKNRERLNQLITNGKTHSEEFAILFYVILRTSFNGMCRYNKKGFFNVPQGDSKPLIREDLLGYKNIMSNWEILSTDFEKILLPDNAFLFVDSPYDETFSSYWVDGFSKDDHVRCIKWAGSTGLPTVLTNNPTDFILSLLEENGFEFKVITKNHSIAADGEKRGKKPEVIAWKNVQAPDKIKRLS
ncbi:Dam family site-specific DNA-(adenine-N6)-methyltransferase [Vibrio sp. 947]|uniref:DNA adenine methylase n=1 Tax=unclassified Vibrio TaxID=2614977 RepID=UPI0029641FC7|nr:MULTISPECIES: Dam family site-specific DNA-(adenine-N6)-methyltransferase [unclassified Vibrio]MDW1583539.1 Dam family site-specific DNA-(adenine-N6)-methyltransferase [Vibrio sp. Vb2897]MDW1641857.1 Dam family site-specific DNA-(adenine-N6)-methyltransferase [Vibrio sp. Vb2896]MDW1928132.1 Dam family site-specific DNA-(adenine-N6)-methyltransferase [Vibrio sp. 947]